MAAGLAAASLGLDAYAAPPAQAGLTTYDIPPQPLPSAVEAYAVIAGVQVLYDKPLGEAPRSPGVRGMLTPQAALEGLLAGTGLEAHFTDAHNVILGSPASVAKASPGEPPRGLPSLDLGTIHIIARPVLEAMPRPSGGARLYGALVKASVVQALATDAETSRDHYVADVSLWISPSGAVRNVAIFNSSGNKRVDAAICSVLGRMSIDDGPPDDLLQPLNIRIVSTLHR